VETPHPELSRAERAGRVRPPWPAAVAYLCTARALAVVLGCEPKQSGHGGAAWMLF
jgi:hypothetical protein